MYDNLKSLGINQPEDVDRYSLRQEANNDILKIYFRKDKGEFFAKSVKFKYPRQRKTVVADNAGQGYKEIHEINPNLRYVIDELDQLCQRDQVEVDLKRKILDDLRHLEGVVSHKIAGSKPIWKNSPAANNADRLTRIIAKAPFRGAFTLRLQQRAPLLDPRAGSHFRLRLFHRIDLQHFANAGGALLLQQRVECAPRAAEVVIAAVAEGDQPIAQLRLVADPIANGVEQRRDAVRQIALPGGGGDHQRVMLTIKLPGLQRALFEQFDLMALLAEDVLRFFRHQQRIAVDRSHEDTNLSHGSYSLHYL